MKLYLVNADNIYFPQIKEYYREIVSSYDNGNYRSAMVMLYSTIVCDLLLKLKELSDVYNDKKAEKILKEINEERKKKGNSAWEWDLIETIRERTELLSDESYAMIDHIYDLRNFSAHPAMNDDYELISPSPEMTVAYIKKALEDILVKPSVFADSIVHRMSDDISSKKERYRADIEAFEHYLNKVYFQRMSAKMVQKVFKAFWKFAFIKTADDGEVYPKDRYINRKTLEAMLNKYHYELCEYIEQNKSYFTISEDSACMAHACVLLAYYPQVYGKLDETVHHQLSSFKEKDIVVIKWFENGDLEKYLSELKIRKDRIEPKILEILEEICKRQGVPNLFVKMLIDHYANTSSFTSARDRFDYLIEPYLDRFREDDFVRLIQEINKNNQIYNYSGQRARNNSIIASAKFVLPEDFDYDAYEKFRYTKVEEKTEESSDETEIDVSQVPDNDPELPF